MIVLKPNIIEKAISSKAMVLVSDHKKWLARGRLYEHRKTCIGLDKRNRLFPGQVTRGLSEISRLGAVGAWRLKMVSFASRKELNLAP
jgi:hypothetical protein